MSVKEFWKSVTHHSQKLWPKNKGLFFIEKQCTWCETNKVAQNSHFCIKQSKVNSRLTWNCHNKRAAEPDSLEWTKNAHKIMFLQMLISAAVSLLGFTVSTAGFCSFVGHNFDGFGWLQLCHAVLLSDTPTWQISFTMWHFITQLTC